MKKLTLFLYCFAIASSALFGQTATISGIVLDAKTSKPLAFANVYVNRTTLGVSAGEQGTFKLLRIPAGKVELVGSFIGYKSSIVTVELSANQEKQVTITLVPLPTQLQEITVAAKRDKEWANNLEQFKKVFLGKGDFAAHCVITNPEVLDFQREKNELRAQASAPLEILNSRLGYRVNYDLVTFTSTAKQYAIGGHTHFVPLQTNDSTLAKQWIANRAVAYRNSLQYLLKLMIDNEFKQQGFEIYVEKEKGAAFMRSDMFSWVRNYLVPFETSKHVLKFIDGRALIDDSLRIEIHDKRSNKGKTYKDVPNPVTWLETLGRVMLSPEGIAHNPMSVQVLGHMSEFRVAHLLPEDYKPGQLEEIVIEPELTALGTAPSEEIVLHTDKDYYYPGDVIWFKGYMNYSNPSIADSLSRVAYVELIDSMHKTVIRKQYAIESGGFAGHLKLPATIKPGSFVIRSYTIWMRNFGDDNLFVKAIPILSLDERVSRDHLPQELQHGYKPLIHFAKDTYKPREHVTVDLEVIDEDGAFVPADLSVSVVEYEFAKILDVSPQVSKDSSTQTKNFQYHFPIETGITVSGEFKTNRKFNESVTITAVLGNFKDVTTVQTDKEGRFRITGFQFNDSSSLGLQVLDKSKKPYGDFKITENESPPVANFPRVPLQLTRNNNPVPRYGLLDDENFTVLKEVTVTAKKEKREDMYGKGDFTITGEYIRASNRTDIISAIQSRYPSVRVNTYVDNTGFLREQVKIGGFNSGEPLLVVDGVPMMAPDGVARAMRQISVREVERIEVLRFGGAAIYGSRGGSGVISIYTRTQHGDLAGLETSGMDRRGFKSFPILGYAQTKAFPAPDYSKVTPSGEPDYRTTIHWAPNVWFDGVEKSTVSFYAADMPTTYLVIVKGMTINGQPIQARKLITITKSDNPTQSTADN